jgi:hypothetical protein
VADAVVGWDCLPGDAVIKAGPLMVFHGHELAGALGKNPARTVLANYPGQNTYFGHCHRIDVATTPTSKNGRQVVHGAWTGGHLSDPRLQGYAAAFRHGWQQGFSVVEYWDTNPFVEDELATPVVGFTVTPVRIFRDWRGMPVARVMGKTLRGN